MGPRDQPDYVNGVVKRKRSSLLDLLDHLQRLNSNTGVVGEKEQRWGARMLDLDILLFGRVQ